MTLQERHDKLRAELEEVNKALWEEREANALPSRKVRFEGKYFKYCDSYSRQDEYWFVYYYVTNVDEYLNGWKFSIDTDNVISISSFTLSEHFPLQEITKDEFDAAFFELMQKINQYANNE